MIVGMMLAAALWDQYPRLTCRFDVVTVCNPDLQQCERSVGTGVLTFDFPKNTVQALVSKNPYTLDGRRHTVSGVSGFPDVNVAYSGSSLYSFYSITKGAGGVSDEVQGYTQSGIPEQAFTAHMVCHPAQ